MASSSNQSANERGKGKMPESDESIEEDIPLGADFLSNNSNNQKANGDKGSSRNRLLNMCFGQKEKKQVPPSYQFRRGEAVETTISCCIFKIPECLTRNNNNNNAYGYEPLIVSIGPYHHGKQQLKWIEGHKQRFQDFFLEMGAGVRIEDLVNAVKEKIQDIRESYSEDPVEIEKEMTDTVKEKEQASTSTNSNSEAQTKKLINMMVLDGCFLLGLFIKFAQRSNNHEDPLFSMAWALPTIRKDLLLLENQLPLFVLLILLKTANIKDDKMKNLNDIALKFFSESFRKPITYCANHPRHEAKHLLDLIRETFISYSSETPSPSSSDSGPNQPDAAASAPSQPEVIIGIPAETKNPLPRSESGTVQTGGPDAATSAPSQPEAIIGIPAQTENPLPSSESGTVQTGGPDAAASAPSQPEAIIGIPAQTRGPSTFLKLNSSSRKLRSRGVTFKVKREFHSFLDISFKNGVVQIPEIVLDDFISRVLLNCIAFEQLYANSTNHITSYAMFMGSLVNDARDASFLVEEGIIENYYGTDDEVSQFFRRITKDYVFEIEKSYLARVFKEVKEYADNFCNGLWAGFRFKYFGSLWIALSTLGALLLLVLTLLQVIYASKSSSSGDAQAPTPR